MHAHLGITGIIVLTAAAAVAQERLAQRRPAPPSTLAVLRQVVPEMNLTETPLDQAIAWLQDFTKLNMSVRWTVLEDAGLRRDTPITVQARGLRLEQVLWLILNEAGGAEIKLAYRASGNLLVLSTAEDLNKEMITKVYDVADLLVRIPRASRQAMFNVTQGMGQQGGGIGGGGGAGSGMFQQGQQQGQYNDQGTEQAGMDVNMQLLVELIRDTIEPDTWRETGGGEGTIFAFQNLIIVRNTILVHQRLGGYITEEEAVGQ
ncbi:MAG: hypothetical protein AB1716_21025 [Planctomycetota bacterium]